MVAMAAEGSERVRLYVGGLGPGVSASDLERAFGTLGTVLSVEMVRSKDRDFAYLDFEAVSPAALRKVFSTYSGCKWKGGCLRVEKAKEHYLSRLQREWASEKLAASEDVKVKELTVEKTEMRARNFNAIQLLKIFFPRFRKLKSIAARGTGKHKRSFERVEGHPVPLLALCSCDGHEAEATDPFEFEHDRYLRLVDKLEEKPPPSAISETNLDNTLKDVPLSKKDNGGKTAGEAEYGTGKNIPGGVETKNSESSDNVKTGFDDTLKNTNRSSNAKKTAEYGAGKNVSGRQKTRKSNANTALDSLGDVMEDNDDHDRGREAEGDNDQNTAEGAMEDGVKVPALTKRGNMSSAKPTKWDRIFEAAAGLGNTDVDIGFLEGDEDTSDVPGQDGLVSAEAERDTEVPNSNKQKRKKTQAAERPTSVKKQKQRPEDAEGEASRDDGGKNAPEGQNRNTEADCKWVQFASWKSLIGESGNLAFSFENLLGSQGTAVNQVANEEKIEAFDKLPVKDKIPGKDFAKKRSPKPELPPVKGHLENNQACTFMRSSDAEDEWLSSKGKLRSDYRAQHKTALRTKRKLQEINNGASVKACSSLCKWFDSIQCDEGDRCNSL